MRDFAVVIAWGKRPEPIPNLEAKPHSADGTAPGRVWESRTPPQHHPTKEGGRPAPNTRCTPPPTPLYAQRTRTHTANTSAHHTHARTHAKRTRTRAHTERKHAHAHTPNARRTRQTHTERANTHRRRRSEHTSGQADTQPGGHAANQTTHSERTWTTAQR